MLVPSQGAAARCVPCVLESLGVGAAAVSEVNSPDSKSYWGSYFKFRKRCLCALWSLCADAGCRCQMSTTRGLVPLQGAAARCLGLCAWRLGARAAAGCRRKVPLPDAYGRVRFGAWMLAWLPGAAGCCEVFVAVCPLESVCW